MQTELPADFLATARGARADQILRSCVHCGFCNATCPTYQLLGDELDGPRGRIYLIKDMLETREADEITRLHLDRCLTCRACETTCPSGVKYGELLEIGRHYLEAELPRRRIEHWARQWMLAVLPRPGRFRFWLRLGNVFRGLMPAGLRSRLPRLPRNIAAPAAASTVERSGRRVLVLEGCVQSVTTPEVNRAFSALLGARGIEVVSAPGCCGGLALHLGEEGRAHQDMARYLDNLGSKLANVEAVVSTASGCGVTVKEYDRLLADDLQRREAALQLANHTLDVAEYLHRLDTRWERSGSHRRVAWHSPCTLQHGQQVTGLVESLLEAAGYELVPVKDSHLCCGSAGSYSLLQPELAGRLKHRKLVALREHRPEVIATANVGCQLHLATEAGIPVVHWLQLLR